MAKIEFQGVSKYYEDTLALDNMNLTIEDNEFLVLLGPSGAGKTTILKIIAGLEPVSEGNLYFDGQDVKHKKPFERDIAMVFESYALYPHKTVRENIINPLKSAKHRGGREDAEQKVYRTAALLKMEKYLDRMPSQLSGGQRQRVAMGRALVRDPRIFLLDEPLAHVDAKIREELRKELRKIKESIKSTIVYVTHDYLEALSLGHRIAVINKGRLEQVGTPKEVYFQPANIFVAAHIGNPEINLFDAKVSGSSGGAVIRFTELGIEYELPGNLLPEGIFEVGEVVVGVRPQFIDFSIDSESMNSRNAFKAKLAVYENLKTEINIIASLQNKEFSILSYSAPDLQEGQDIYADFQPDKLLFFSKTTGKRI